MFGVKANPSVQTYLFDDTVTQFSDHKGLSSCNKKLIAHLSIEKKNSNK